MGRPKKTLKVKEPIRIRERKLANGNTSLYLDIYQKGTRKYESLNLYLIPVNAPDAKLRNAETRAIAEKIKADRIIALQGNSIKHYDKIKRSSISLIDFLKEYENDSFGFSQSTLKGRSDMRKKVEEYLDEEGLSYIKNDKHKRLIAYMEKLTGNKNILYTIIDGVGLQKRIRMNAYWRKLLIKNYSVIRSWVQYNKAQFLQDRNPGVPGIMYKICPENEDQRKLDQVRALWRATVDVTGRLIREIYTGREIDLDVLSIDHFVPRSYISNDELWDLIPMSKSLNSSKNNRLPLWDEYFEPFAHYQYYLYSLVFPEDESKKSAFLIDKFEKCRKNNVNAIWASEALYIPGNSKTQFVNILSHNLKPIYESAQLQGYDMWNMKV